MVAINAGDSFEADNQDHARICEPCNQAYAVTCNLQVQEPEHGLLRTFFSSHTYNSVDLIQVEMSVNQATFIETFQR